MSSPLSMNDGARPRPSMASSGPTATCLLRTWTTRRARRVQTAKTGPSGSGFEPAHIARPDKRPGLLKRNRAETAAQRAEPRSLPKILAKNPCHRPLPRLNRISSAENDIYIFFTVEASRGGATLTRRWPDAMPILINSFLKRIWRPNARRREKTQPS